MTRLMLLCLLALPGFAAAQAPATPAAAPPPRDTTPPGAYFGVTEYQLAREKLEKVMQKDGFRIFAITFQPFYGQLQLLPVSLKEGDIFCFLDVG